MPISQVSGSVVDTPMYPIFNDTGTYRLIVGDEIGLGSYAKFDAYCHINFHQKAEKPMVQKQKPSGWNWLIDRFERATVRDRHNMTCGPLDVRAGDVLTARLPANHGAELAIVSPREQFHVVSHPTGEGEPVAPLSSVYLRATDVIKIPTDKAQSYQEGKLVPVFRQYGTYRILVGENLKAFSENPESEGEARKVGVDGYCSFNFVWSEQAQSARPFDLIANGWTGLQR